MAKKLHPIELLPEYLRTYPNKSFFKSTIDRVFSHGNTKTVNAYIGKKPSYYNAATDFYKDEPSAERKLFQLEPAVVYDNKVIDYVDYISQISSNGTDVSNPHRPLATEVYSWCPYVNISKLDDYIEYYWCPYGAPIINIENYTFSTQLTEVGVYQYKLRSIAGDMTNPLVKIANEVVNFTKNGDTISLNITETQVGETLTVNETPDLRTIITTYGTRFAYKELCKSYAYGESKYYDFGVSPPALIKSHTRLPSADIMSLERLVHGMVIELTDLTGMKMYEVKIIGSAIELIPYTVPSGEKTKPDYYTIERNSQNRNKWSKNNLWVHRDALLYSHTDYPTTRAVRPIIEYNGSLKLFNYGLYRKDDIQYAYQKSHGFGLYDSINEGLTLEYDKALLKNITVEELNTLGYNLYDNGRIVIMDSTAQYENKVYKTKLFNTSDYSTATIISANERRLINASLFDYHDPTGNNVSYFSNMPFEGGTFVSELQDVYPNEPQKYDYVEISNNGYYNHGSEISFDGEQWGYSQQYIAGTQPKFDLYDEDGTSFASKTKYAGSGFAGASVFDYKEDQSNGTFDSIIGKYLIKNTNRNYIFNDFLSVPFVYNGTKKNKFIALVKNNTFTYGNHWHLSNYSLSEKENNLFMVHSSIRANPMNYNVSDISKNQWIEHFITLKNQIWNQSTDGIDYSKGLKLLQHRNSSVLSMSLLTSGIDFLEALKYNEREYSKFHNLFLRRLEKYDESTGLPALNIINQEFVVSIIKKMVATKNETHPYFDNTTGELNTFIPNTPAYLGITRLHTPTETDNYVIGHDGSYYQLNLNIDRDIANKLKHCVYILETLIYNEALKHGASISKHGFDFSEVVGNYVDIKEYSYKEFFDALTQFYVRWASTMNIDTRTNSTYNQSNPLTYNYRLCNNIFNTSLPGHYRGMYKFLFRTEKPHTHPWEILGHYSKPTWWDNHYSWTIALKRRKLIEAITNGLVSNPDDQLKKYISPINYTNHIPVDSTGKLLSPIECGIILPSSMKEGVFDADWEFGDGSAAEYQFMVSKYSSFGLCGTAFILKPSKLIAGSWLCGDEVYRFNQWTKVSTGSREYDFNQTVHGEIVDGKHIRKLGVQTIITDYFKSLGKNITAEFGNIVRNIETKLVHKFAGFVFDDLTVWSETAGVIPKNNYTTVLHTSPPKSEFHYSGIIVVKKDTGYQVFGYNPLKPYFYAHDVDDTSTAISIALDDKPVPNEWKRNVGYRIGHVVRYGNKIYQAKAEHTSTSGKFTDDKTKFWSLVRILPTADSTVHWYFNKHTEVKKYPYGHEFVDIQQVVDFMNGYQHYLESLGFEFNQLDKKTKSRKDFKYLVDELLSFDDKNFSLPQGNYPTIHLSPGAGEITFNYKFGFVENLLQSRNGLFSIVDARGIAINKDSLEFHRTDNSITIKSNSTDGIFGLRIGLKEAEHAIIFDNKTSFGNVIYNSVYDIRQERLRISCTTPETWDGSINVDGALVIDGLAYPNFENNIDDMRKLYTSSKSKNQKYSDLVKSSIGYKDRDYLDSLMLNHQNKFEFYQGMIQHKGTPTVNDRLLRSEKLVQNKDINFAEEWAFNVGRYGNVSSANNLDIVLNKNDLITKDILVVANDVSNTLSSAELTNLDTDNTAIVLYSNAINKDSRILDGYVSESLFKLESSMKTDNVLSAGYIIPKDFTYSMISDVYFNKEFINDAYDLKANDTLHFVYTNPYVVDNTVIHDRMVTLNVTSYSKQILELTIGASGVELIFGGTHNFLPGDYIYIDKSAYSTNDLYGVFVVLDVGQFSVTLNINEEAISPCVYNTNTPACILLSRTSVKLEVSTANSNYISANVLYPSKVVISGIEFGYYIELDNTNRNRQTYPHIRGNMIENGLYYFECGFAANGYDLLPTDKPRWAIFKYNNGILTKIAMQQLCVDISSIVDIQIYKQNSNLDLKQRVLDANPIVTDNIQIVNLAEGRFPGVIDKDIDFISITDPADYSNWNNTQENIYWLNTRECSFYDINTRLTNTVSDLHIKETYASQMVKGSNPIVFVWSINDVLPIDYKGSGTLLATDKYSTFKVNGKTKYGYWITDILDIPQNKRFSVNVIKQYIENIDKSGIEMMLPLSTKSFILKNISIGHDTFVRVKTDYNRDTQKFAEYTLLRSNDATSIPPDELWNSLVYSLASVTIDRKKIPSASLSSVDKLGCDFKSGQTWFKDINGARAYAMQSLNRIFARSNICNTRTNINSLYASDIHGITQKMQWIKSGTHAFKYYPNPALYDLGPLDTIADIPATSTPKRVLMVDDTFWRVIDSSFKYDSGRNTTTYVNNVATMYSKEYVSTDSITSADIGNYILIRESANSLGKIVKPRYNNGLIIAPVVFTQEIKTSDVVSLTDWYSTGYDSTMNPIFIPVVTFDTTWYELGKPEFISTVIDNKWVWLKYTKTKWEIVAVQDGTIFVNNWNKTDRDHSYDIGTLLGLIRDNVFTTAELNEFFFDMVKYVLSEQNSVHWFFKTSYMHISGYAASMEKTPVQTADAIESLIEYINEVKPYHVKVRDYTSIYNTYCGLFKVKLSNENMTTSSYKPLRSPYNKLPFDTYVWSENARIDYYVKTTANIVYWIMYKDMTTGNWVGQDILGNVGYFSDTDLSTFSTVEFYDIPFSDVYLPDEFYTSHSINLKSRLYILKTRNQTSIVGNTGSTLDSLITKYNITF